MSTIVIACRDQHGLSADTGRAITRQAASPVIAVDSIAAAVHAACGEVASGWRAIPNIALHVAADSFMNVLGADADSVRGCSVAAEDSLAFAKSDSVRLDRDGPAKFSYWNDHARHGWSHLIHTQADGPDGSSTAYQRGLVRCYVSEAWDGGDDEDSTSVPSPWYRQETSCWWHGRPLTAHDTASG